MDIWLSDHGDPHWLSAKGKVDHEKIRRKHRAAHFIVNRVINPVTDATLAKLHAAHEYAKAKEAEALKKKLARYVKLFNEAISLIDDSEVRVRDLIENDLMDVAGINRTRVNEAMTVSDKLAETLAKVRARAIKRGFKHLRDHLKIKTIYEHTLATWCKAIIDQEAQRIKVALRVGLISGEDNTDIAHRIVGSRRVHGANGVTEQTRQQIIRLGRRFLREKTRMSGARPDVR